MQFPPGFFDRADPSADARFYAFDRFVTHIDDEAIAAVGELYGELQPHGRRARSLLVVGLALRPGPDRGSSRSA